MTLSDFAVNRTWILPSGSTICTKPRFQPIRGLLTADRIDARVNGNDEFQACVARSEIVVRLNRPLTDNERSYFEDWVLIGILTLSH